MRSYMNVPSVAKMFGVNIQTVRGYIRSGELPAARVGRRYVIERDDVEKFIEKRKDTRKLLDMGLTEKGKETVQKVKETAAKIQAYLEEAPGANNDEISEALGIDPDDTQRALRSLEGKDLAFCELDDDKPDRRQDPWYSTAGTRRPPRRNGSQAPV